MILYLLATPAHRVNLVSVTYEPFTTNQRKCIEMKRAIRSFLLTLFVAFVCFFIDMLCEFATSFTVVGAVATMGACVIAALCRDEDEAPAASSTSAPPHDAP